jgi:hypothetical protein
MTTIDWGDLLVRRRLHDNDVVTATLSANGMAETQITLNLARPLTWWKGIQVFDDSDAQIAFVKCQGLDGHAGPAAIPSCKLDVGARLVLWKAKSFGIATPMYVIAGLEILRGQNVIVHWQAD